MCDDSGRSLLGYRSHLGRFVVRPHCPPLAPYRNAFLHLPKWRFAVGAIKSVRARGKFGKVCVWRDDDGD